MNHRFDQHFESAGKHEKDVQEQLAEVDKKIEDLEDQRYLEKKVPEESFQRMWGKLIEQKTNIQKELEKTNVDSSNLKQYFEHGVNLSMKLSSTWSSSPVASQEKIQKTLFPEGIVYNLKNGSFRTSQVSRVFEAIAVVNRIPEGDKNKQGSNCCCLVQFSREDSPTQKALYHYLSINCNA